MDRRVALTFDDLPMTGGPVCNASRVREVTERLTQFLGARSIPAAGLASPGRECITPGLLEETLGRWIEIGAVIGNHTATHPDLNETPVADYLADIERAQARIDAVVSTDARWFRPPYLHTGDDPEKKAALDEYLAANGYRVAVVTVDNQEWVYAAVYADARARGDEALAARVVDAYVAHLEDCMAFYERLSMAVFGREIPQVLLLHANRLNADHLGRVVEMLERRGYRFIGMPEALADPAFAREDTYIGPRGLSWLQRWALEAGVRVPPEPREDGWVAEAFHASRRRGADAQAAGLADAQRAVAAASYFALSPRGPTVAHAMTSEALRITGGVATDIGTWRHTWRSNEDAEGEASGRYRVAWRRGEDGCGRIEFDVWHRPVDR